MADNVHERVWERTPDRPSERAGGMLRPSHDWKPYGTYGLLGTMLVVFILENATASDAARFEALWTVGPQWWLRPWTPITSTFAHGSVNHLLINGFVLFIFGPILERILGLRRFLVLFIASGALSGILQVEINQAVFGDSAAALGASGAIMMVFGALAVVMPTQKILLFFIIPVPFWAAAAGYAAYDLLLGVVGTDNVGHFAHLAGMALGAAVGLRLRQRMRERGLVFR